MPVVLLLLVLVVLMVASDSHAGCREQITILQQQIDAANEQIRQLGLRVQEAEALLRVAQQQIRTLLTLVSDLTNQLAAEELKVAAVVRYFTVTAVFFGAAALVARLVIWMRTRSAYRKLQVVPSSGPADAALLVVVGALFLVGCDTHSACRQQIGSLQRQVDMANEHISKLRMRLEETETRIRSELEKARPLQTEVDNLTDQLATQKRKRYALTIIVVLLVTTVATLLWIWIRAAYRNLRMVSRFPSIPGEAFASTGPN